MTWIMQVIIKNLIQFLFRAGFLFWLLLAALELLMPGFVIYYISLNWLLLVVVALGVGAAIANDR
jgi:hypothetical protein